MTLLRNLRWTCAAFALACTAPLSFAQPPAGPPPPPQVGAPPPPPPGQAPPPPPCADPAPARAGRGRGAAPPPAPPPPPDSDAPQPPLPPPANAIGPIPPDAAATTTLHGTIRSFNYGPDGAINGFILDDRTIAYLPPGSGAQLGASLRPGSQVTISGALRAGPNGNRLMDAQTVTNRRTGAVLGLGPR